LSGLRPGNYDAAVAFTVNQAQSYTLDTVEVPLVYLEGENSIAIRIYSDVGGLPGAELGSTQLSGIPASAALLTADFHAQLISLMAGASYWLVGDAAQDTTVLWHFNDLGQLGIADRTTGPWIRLIGIQTTPALRVNGTAVPEIASPALAAFALVSLLRVRRK
jgi:hypothetical protein